MRTFASIVVMAASSIAAAEPVWDGITGTVKPGAPAPALESYDVPYSRAMFGFRVGVGAERITGGDGLSVAPRLGANFKLGGGVLTPSFGYSTINAEIINRDDVTVVVLERDVRLNL